ncbi:2-phospho-L-lactate guanylyltransferase [Nostocoides sp. HKS02]|uniref:2-phospho-L-lactate guanylyltransferase n=1 Tax=Nostocoides sp. HKS02 TaxID=1813880 RepID=UPI0012B4E19C|nr:2-phospho-L-lactate guanylyltransferase [Tetrasphaera sp. HKS02]QGN57863.1 2-phospho-L-lactate guanylyltransferase [Tetrasphaera sp. HKS02]
MSAPQPPLPWRLVVPVKGGPTAKSRLHPPPGVAREALALAFAEDCLTACAAGMPRGRLFVVTSDAHVAALARGLGATVVDDPGHGLDAAVAAGRDEAVAHAGAPTPLAVLLGDLPALRPGDLQAALEAAAAYDRAVVPDAAGTGTVLITARDGARLRPSFGEGSAARHAALGHVPLDLPLPHLRSDVDDDAGLAMAMALGVGPATRAVLGVLGGGVDDLVDVTTLRSMQASVHTFDETSGAGSVLLDDGREVAFSAEVFAGSALRHLRTGQRLSIDLTPTRGAEDQLGAPPRVTKLWIVGIGDDQTIG